MLAHLLGTGGQPRILTLDRQFHMLFTLLVFSSCTYLSGHACRWHEELMCHVAGGAGGGCVEGGGCGVW